MSENRGLLAQLLMGRETDASVFGVSQPLARMLSEQQGHPQQQPMPPRVPEHLTRLAQALAPSPNTTYLNIVPQAQDKTTGEWRWAMPNMARGLLSGGVDLLAGPYTGQMTPDALGTLASLPAPGMMAAPRGAITAMGGRPAKRTGADPAASMGFTEKTYYHGTDKDFSSFGKDKVNDRFPQSFGFHLTDRPQEANSYARNGIDPSWPVEKAMLEGGNVMPLRARYKNPLVIHTQHPAPSMEADINRAGILRQLQEAKDAGNPYDAVLIKRERGDEWDGENLIVFDPSQIRSVFAQFDKRKSKSGNLLSSGGAGPYGAFGGPLVLGEKEM